MLKTENSTPQKEEPLENTKTEQGEKLLTPPQEEEESLEKNVQTQKATEEEEDYIEEENTQEEANQEEVPEATQKEATTIQESVPEATQKEATTIQEEVPEATQEEEAAPEAMPEATQEEATQEEEVPEATQEEEVPEATTIQEETQDITDDCTIKENVCKVADYEEDKLFNKIVKEEMLGTEPEDPIKKTKYNNSEEKIGEKIKEQFKTPPYYYMYSPVIFSCSIEVETMDINKCITKNHPEEKIKSLTMRDEGKIDIREKIKNVAEISTESETLCFILDTFLYLLNSIEELNKSNIIHNDLKIENIKYNEKTETPILVNFEKAFITENKEEEWKNIKDEKFQYTTSAHHNNIEKILFQHLLEKSTKETENKEGQQEQEQIDDTIIESYYAENELYKEESQIFNKDEIPSTEKIKENYKTIKDCIDTKNRWDIYALISNYLVILRDASITNNEKEESILLLKEYIINKIEWPEVRKKIEIQLLKAYKIDTTE
jgi:hypothetical protein